MFTLEPIDVAQVIQRGWTHNPEGLRKQDCKGTYVLKHKGVPVEVIALHSLPWDTQVLGWPTGKISEHYAIQTSPRLDFNALAPIFQQLGWRYVLDRLAMDNWPRIQALEASGFRMLDGIVRFVRQLDGTSKIAPNLRLATAADAAAVADLSARAFTQSRFHNDHLISPEVARRVHGEWAKNSVLGIQAQAVWLKEASGRPCGFITCKVSGTDGTIDLIAVAEEFAGQGLGTELVEAACAWFEQQKCRQVFVQTQTLNLRAQTLYTKLGFRPESAAISLRWSDLDR